MRKDMKRIMKKRKNNHSDIKNQLKKKPIIIEENFDKYIKLQLKKKPINISNLNINKNNFLLPTLLVAILVLVISFSKTSYAIFKAKVEGEKNYSFQVGTLDFEIQNESNSIRLLNAYPMQDTEGQNLTPYTFTIKNTGTIKANYAISLLDDETLKTNCTGCEFLEKDRLKIELKENGKNVLGPILLSEVNKLRIGSIDAGVTNTYELRIWLDYNNTTTLDMGKYYYGRISVFLAQETAYKEELLNGSDPVLSDNLIPVTIDSTGVVKKANIYEEWYNYSNKNWANAVILKDESITYNSGDVIEEDNIESYFVWIPKYSYQLWDLGNYNSSTSIDTGKNKPINIRFGLTNTSDSNDGECTTPMLSGATGNCIVGDYMTHPAFISMNSNGLWIGKFETGYDGATNTGSAQVNSSDSSKVVIKPNIHSWRSIQPANAHLASFNYNRMLDSHMMKNTEWGAVAYLTNSIYGTCTDTTCSEVRINNNSAYLTGYAAISSDTTTYSSTAPKTDGTDTLNYLNPLSVSASTTGNYSGIYDMSGGAWDFVMGVLVDSSNSGAPLSGRNNLWNSGFNGKFGCPTCNSTTTGVDSSILSLTTGIDFPDSKYYDIYNYGTSSVNYYNRILGDATGELGPFADYHSSFNNDFAHFAISSFPWFRRGGYYGSGSDSGTLGFANGYGSADSNSSFRLVLAPKE